MNYRLGHRHLHYRVVATWSERSHLAHTAAQACTCGKHGGSSHAFASGYEQRIAHHALMGEIVAVQHHLSYEVGLNG